MPLPLWLLTEKEERRNCWRKLGDGWLPGVEMSRSQVLLLRYVLRAHQTLTQFTVHSDDRVL